MAWKLIKGDLNKFTTQNFNSYIDANAELIYENTDPNATVKKIRLHKEPFCLKSVELPIEAFCYRVYLDMGDNGKKFRDSCAIDLKPLLVTFEAAGTGEISVACETSLYHVDQLKPFYQYLEVLLADTPDLLGTIKTYMPTRQRTLDENSFYKNFAEGNLEQDFANLWANACLIEDQPQCTYNSNISTWDCLYVLGKACLEKGLDTKKAIKAFLSILSSKKDNCYRELAELEIANLLVSTPSHSTLSEAELREKMAEKIDMMCNITEISRGRCEKLSELYCQLISQYANFPFASIQNTTDQLGYVLKLADSHFQLKQKRQNLKNETKQLHAGVVESLKIIPEMAIKLLKDIEVKKRHQELEVKLKFLLDPENKKICELFRNETSIEGLLCEYADFEGYRHDIEEHILRFIADSHYSLSMEIKKLETELLQSKTKINEEKANSVAKPIIYSSQAKPSVAANERPVNPEMEALRKKVSELLPSNNVNEIWKYNAKKNVIWLQTSDKAHFENLLKAHNLSGVISITLLRGSTDAWCVIATPSKISNHSAFTNKPSVTAKLS